MPVPLNHSMNDTSLAKRVLVLGLDGATWDVLRPLMDAGTMPQLRAFVERGVSAPLPSTKPPITPAAWMTFLTGRQPGSHGVVDFERYDPATNRLSFNSTFTTDRSATLPAILARHGLKTGWIHVPMCYPAVATPGGFMISGFEAGSLAARDIAQPPELAEEIRRLWPDYALDERWRRDWRRSLRGEGDHLFEENVAAMARSFEQGEALLRHCARSLDWDVLMIVYKLVDNLQHKAWKYLDPRFEGRSPHRRRIVRTAFAKLDETLGRLFEYADQKGATVLIVSDHGHGSLDGKVHPNRMLLDWGYLHLTSKGDQAATRIAKLAGRLFLGSKRRFQANVDLAKDLAVDFDRTRACVVHAGMAGFLYLNLAGRQPGGIVPPSQYDALREELRERFLSAAARDAAGRPCHPFVEVFRPEVEYGCRRGDQPWLPDLVLTPAPGLAVVRKMRGAGWVQWLPWRKLEGTHRPEGIFAAAGPGIRSAQSHSTALVGTPAEGARNAAYPENATPLDSLRMTAPRLLDMAPTLLTLLGLPVPAAMTGRACGEFFDRPVEVVKEAATVAWNDAAATKAQTAEPGRADGAANAEAYTPEQAAKMAERLAQLGYLE